MTVDVELLADLPFSPNWLLVMSLILQFLNQNASTYWTVFFVLHPRACWFSVIRGGARYWDKSLLFTVLE